MKLRSFLDLLGVFISLLNLSIATKKMTFFLFIELITSTTITIAHQPGVIKDPKKLYLT